jgi:hypothetical protein
MSRAREIADLGSPAASGLSNKNIIINGAATVHQRGNQATTNGGFVYFVDRFNVFHNCASAVANLQQSTVVPSGQGFGNSMLIDVTTADTSIASGEVAVLRQVIEGQNLQRLSYGTSSAKSLTISFWVRSTKTGTYTLEIYHNATQARNQNHPYTISQADTWEYKSITFSGDTSATIDNDNQATFYVQWALAAGSDYTSGTQQTTWANFTNANRFAGQVNFFDSTSNNFYLTGVQMEVGEVATPFEHEDIGTTLAKCQRYFFRFQSDTNYDAFAPAYWLVTTQVYSMYEFPVTMRDQPAMTVSSFTANDWRIHSNGGDGNLGSLIINRCTPNNVQTYSDQSSNTGTAGYAGAIRNYGSTSPYIEFSAEL